MGLAVCIVGWLLLVLLVARRSRWCAVHWFGQNVSGEQNSITQRLLVEGGLNTVKHRQNVECYGIWGPDEE